jgi:hypothetical protein
VGGGAAAAAAATTTTAPSPPLASIHAAPTPVSPAVHATVAPAKEYEAVAVTDFDAEVAMKHLGDFTSGDDLKISVFDFAGQSVFASLHQLFLSSSSIYIIVFSLFDLIKGSEDEKRRASEYIVYWIESVLVHTLDRRTMMTAPVFFVGTHKDKVPDPADHDKASKILYDLLKQRGAGALLRIVPNERGFGAKAVTTHQMFVVDNTIGSSDVGTIDLMAAIERVARDEPYVLQHKPVSWLKFADLMRASSAKGSSFVSVKEAEAVAQSVGIPSRDLEPLLQFLHASGILVWFPEPSLKDVVILDPSQFFVRPATLIIRKHEPTDEDPTHHTSVS